MRITAALKSDFNFQFKQGFYVVYLLVTAVYVIVLQKIPAGIVKEYLIPMTIYTDPAIVGFFFIGAIVMLEKQQGILDCLAVTPLSPMEYLISKTGSLGVLALTASLAIAVAARTKVNIPLLLAAVLLSSVFFTLYGFIAAGGCRTVNQYFLRAVPLMLLAILPCVSIIGFPFSCLFRALPSVAGLELTVGAYRGISPMIAAADIIILLFWVAVIFWVALRAYDQNSLQGGSGE